MMKFTRSLATLLACLPALCPAVAQTVNAAQQVTLQGLLSVANHGSFTAAAYAPDGTLILLLNQNDGIRLLKTNSASTTLIAQSHQGVTGDIALALALDPSGNIYVTGTSTSGALSGTAGVPYPSPANTSTNSFLAKYDTNLNLLWLTFLGAGQTAASGIAATADAAFVTGITFNSAFPVTASGVQQSPAPGSSENGFVARFNATGTAVVYATYLTGANGNTTPTSIAADTNDNAYITGSTTAAGYPTVSALVPNMLGTNSGFLTALNPTGSAILYATFIPGAGLNSIALDAATQTLLLSGNVALGQFPIATVAAPLAETTYQSLLRIPLNGQSVTSSTLLVPSSQSFVSVGPSGTAWVSGAITTPLFPGTTQPDYPTGDSFLLHLTIANTFDQTLRTGGLPTNNPAYASLTTNVAAPAISTTGTIALPGTLSAITSSSLLATQTFDLPLVQTPNVVLPNTLTGVLPVPATCLNSSQCTGTAALLALITTATSAPSLSFSIDDLPNLTLRNLGSATATGLVLTISGYTLTSNCGTTLQPSTACSIALTGTGPGSITASAANVTTYTLSLPATTLTPASIFLSTSELDFSIVTSTSPAATQTFTVSNLSATPQNFTSAFNAPPKGATTFTFAQSATTCAAAGPANTFTLAANTSCTITLSLTASNLSANDSAINALWLLGTRYLKLTGFQQAASLNLSASEVDFGTQFSNTPTLDLPRYLYISNNSTLTIPHTPATLPATSPFTITDNCPITLEPQTVCSLTLKYLSPTAPSDDSTALTLDDSLTVLLTGQTLPPVGVTGSTPDPNLSVSTTSLTFSAPVIVTGISGNSQTVTLTNTGASAFALTIALTGDFQLTNSCPATLAAKATCQLQLAFTPSQPGQRDGLLSITAGSNFSPGYVSLTGTGSAILPANNGTLSLGQTFVGEPTTTWFLIQQSLPSLTAASSSALFNVVLVPNTGTVPTTLPPSSFTQTTTAACTNCYLGVQFLSQTPGMQTAALTLSTVSGGNPYQLILTATALPVQGLLLTPIAQDFGPVPLGSSSPTQTFTLANLLPASASATITSIAVTGDFSLTPNTTGGPTCAATLAPTAACFLQIAFTPTATGQRTGTLTVITSGGTTTSTLTGFGNPSTGLNLNPNALIFQNVPGPTATTQTIAVSNTGTATLSIGTPTPTSPSFSATSNCATLAPAATCTIIIQFAATTATVFASLAIPVTSTQSGQSDATIYSVPLTGAYTLQDAGLEILPNQVNFGSSATGTLGYTRQFTVNNLTAKPLTVALSMPQQFPLATTNSCATLAANASCTFSVSFLPVIAGALTGTVFAQGTPTDGSAPVQALAYMLAYADGPATLTITGNEIPNNALSFGQLTSGQATQQTLTLTNSGTTQLTVHRITSNPPFLSTTTCGITLAPLAACTVTLTYAPIYQLLTGSTNLTPRTDTGTLLLESDAAASPQLMALSGTAVPVLSSSPISSAILAAFQLSQGSLTFANTPIGNASTAQTVTLTNTGTTTLQISSIQSSTDFTSTTTCTTLLPGATCNLTVQFTPTTASTSTVRAGTLQILSNASTSLNFLTLFGISSASPLTLAPTALNFGTVDVGSSDQLSVLITNTTPAPVTFTGLTASGDYAASNGTCPATGSTLAAAASCTLQVTFTPTIAGTRTGTLSLSTNATTLSLTVSLTGTAVLAQLQITPGALAFGSIDIASPAILTITLLNTGSASVTGIVTSITGPNAADFAVTSPCSTTTLTPNQGCTAQVTFTPLATGARSATLSIASSDPNSPTLIPLTGSGVQGGSFLLTAGGGLTETATVPSGSPATYALTLTPLNGFTGTVALTCTPITPGTYATCSLLSPTLTLAVAPQNSTATLNTITSASSIGLALLTFLATPGILLGCLLFRRDSKRASRIVALFLAALACTAISGCGGSSPSSTSNLRYTPAGTYQYQVTATSTSGAPISSTVTLILIVQ